MDGYRVGLEGVSSPSLRNLQVPDGEGAGLEGEGVEGARIEGLEGALLEGVVVEGAEVLGPQGEDEEAVEADCLVSLSLSVSL